MELLSNNHCIMKIEIKICPKCGSKFECNNQNILKCGCAKIPLNNYTRQLISAQYSDCLCVSCLKEFSILNVSESELNN